jgi:hypothetical protein
MAGMTVEFFPRWTTLSGSAAVVTYASPWFDIRAYKTLTIDTLLRGQAGTGTISVTFQYSDDMDIATTISADNLTLGTVDQAVLSNPAGFVRVVMSIPSTTNAATIFSIGTARES